MIQKAVLRYLLLLPLAFAWIGCAPEPPPHGTAYIVQIETNGVAATDASVLNKRQKAFSRLLKDLGVYGYFEQLPGARLQIKVPRLNPATTKVVRQSLAANGRLEFRMVHPESEQLVAAGIVDPGYELLRQEVRNPDGSTNSHSVSFLVNKKPELTGKHIVKASVMRHPLTDDPEISFELDREGAKIFEAITTRYSPTPKQYFQLAIVVDGALYSAPRIMGPIPGGRGQITGSFTAKEATALANILQNPFDPPHRIVEETTF
jgi:SecD/SecF fusion protein